VLTQCPKCESIYRLGAADLGSAQGFVECGECGEQFNALERLADEPKFPSETSPPAAETVAPETPPDTAVAPRTPGPAFVLFDATDGGADGEPDLVNAPAPPPAAESSFIDLDPVPEETELAALFDGSAPSESGEEIGFEMAPAVVLSEEPAIEIDIPEGSATSTLSESEHAILFTDPGAELEDEIAEDIESLDIDDDIPAILQAEVAALNRQRTKPLRWLWVSLVVLFIAGLSLQLGWIFRGRVVAVVPDSLPIYLAACERLGCDIETTALPEAIELVSRDVRDHPQYRDTLLVNATLVSRSDSATQFPVIQLGLYGQAGEVIGIRRFEPIDYLDKSIDLAAGMPPNRPVYIVMEVAGVGGRAISFEFTFL